jgi:uncharacterized membrane protein YdjX (TVP38/TMEM64 family)
MSAGSHPSAQPVGYVRRLLPLVAIIILAAVGFYTIGGEISFDALVRHRTAIDTFVTGHRVLAVLAYLGIYILTVALSLPGATFLTVAGGFLFGVVIGATAAVLGATIGATLIFLAARTALGEPLLRWAGPRANKLASEFREEAFRYLLFLRLVPVFPFFIVNLVPAFAGVRLGPFVAATALGIIPAAIAFAFAGTGLDSVITAQVASYHQCLGSGAMDCRMTFDPTDILTPQMISALVVLGLLVLMPVVVKRWRARSPKAM